MSLRDSQTKENPNENFKSFVGNIIEKVVLHHELSSDDWFSLRTGLLQLTLMSSADFRPKNGDKIGQDYVSLSDQLELIRKNKPYSTDGTHTLDYLILREVLNKFYKEQENKKTVDFRRGSGPVLEKMLRLFEEVKVRPGAIIEVYQRNLKIWTKMIDSIKLNQFRKTKKE